MHITRRQWLLGAAAGAAALRLGRLPAAPAAAPGAPRNLLLILARGGWDTTYSIDPKPGLGAVDAPAGTVRRFGDLDILTDASRPAIAAYFEAYAEVTAVVRGISVRSIAHAECQKRVLTGSGKLGRPDLAAAVAHELGRELPLPYLMLGEVAYAGPYAALAGRVGKSNQLSALVDPAQAYDLVGVASPFRPTGADRQAVREFLRASAERERAVRGAHGYNRARLDDFVDSLHYAREVRSNAAGFGAPGRNLSLVDQGKLAVDVFEQGVSRAASLDAQMLFDTHSDNARQGPMQDQFFAALKTIVDDLRARPGAGAGSTLFDETIVYVVSEMGRTPKINGQRGKDHWPVTSALVIAPAVRGGRAYGATSDRMEAELVDLATGEVRSDGHSLQTSALGAGVLALCGVEPETYFPGVEPFHALAA